MRIHFKPMPSFDSLLTSIFLTFAITAASAQSTGTRITVDRSDDYAALTQAPDKARLRNNPLERDTNAVRAGKKLFGQHCAECHGRSAEGSNRAPSLLEDEVQRATPGTLFWLLSNGVVRRGMPVWSKLPEPQRWQLVTYIKTLNSAPLTVENQKP